MKNLRRQESGQTAILLVMILTVVCLLFVLPLDAGIWYLDHRIAQNQADAAVLAAAQHLPAVDTTPATVAANTWLEKNGSGPADLACLEYSDLHPPDGRFDTLKVCVRRQSPGVFSQLAGLEFIYIGASASATAVGKPGVYSIFSNHSCPDSVLKPRLFRVEHDRHRLGALQLQLDPKRKQQQFGRLQHLRWRQSNPRLRQHLQRRPLQSNASRHPSDADQLYLR